MNSKIERDDLIEIGLQAAETPLRTQVKIWSGYSSEKPDTASQIFGCLRTLHRARPQTDDLRILSIGSSDEPHFRLLKAAATEGLWLYDIDPAALEAARERVSRQLLKNVSLVVGNYCVDFADSKAATAALESRLGGKTFDLITFHHALYYSPASAWPEIISTIHEVLLSSPGILHLAMMSGADGQRYTTTWLYNHFIGKFFGLSNDQDLPSLTTLLAKRPEFANTRLVPQQLPSEFRSDSFADFMAVIWMVMLYPDGHQYSLDQRREIIEFVIDNFWQPGRPLVEIQDYLSIHKR